MKPILSQTLQVICAASLAALGLTACESGEPDIVGKWSCTDAKGPSLDVEYKPSGDYAVTYSNGLPPGHGKYERMRERIVYTPDETQPPQAVAASDADADTDADAAPPVPTPMLPDKIVTTYAFGTNGLMLGHDNPDAANSQRFCTRQ